MLSTKKTQTIVDGNGQTRIVTVRPTKYELYGFPEPDIELTEEMRDTAEAMTAKGERDKLMVIYLRNDPEVQSHFFYEEVDGTMIEKKQIKAVRGKPEAAVVAFKRNGLLYVGWSKRNPTLIEETTSTDDGEEVTRTPLEKLHFTKTDALKVAIMRALADTITFSRSKGSAVTSQGKFLPRRIEKILPKFVNRARSYFKTDLANVFETNGSKSNL
jgi:hypothetical protein